MSNLPPRQLSAQVLPARSPRSNPYLLVPKGPTFAVLIPLILVTRGFTLDSAVLRYALAYNLIILLYGPYIGLVNAFACSALTNRSCLFIVTIAPSAPLRHPRSLPSDLPRPIFPTQVSTPTFTPPDGLVDPDRAHHWRFIWDWSASRLDSCRERRPSRHPRYPFQLDLIPSQASDVVPM